MMRINSILLSQILLILWGCEVPRSKDFSESAKKHGDQRVVFSGDFQSKNWFQEFNATRLPSWTDGLHRTELVYDSEAQKNVLQVKYPKGGFGPNETGTQFRTYLSSGFDSLTLSYRVKFGKNFSFVKGGKLPGLVGGHRTGSADSADSVVSGGYKPSGSDGFSARMMWRSDGRIVQYVYNKNQPTDFGEDFPWKGNTSNGASSDAKFQPGVWHTVRTRIELNEPGKRNGKIVSWLDGQLALEAKNLEYRNLAEIEIDSLYFSTFFGGNGSEWAAEKDEVVYFDEFRVTE